MKKSLLLLGMLPFAAFAQQTVADSTVAVTSADGIYPNTFSSGSANVRKFDNASRFFNDWSISVGGGTALMTHADVTSFYDKKVNWGWTAYASVDKQINHIFALGLQYSTGRTNQKALLPNATAAELAGVATAWTKFQNVSLLGDVNLTNLMRRVDNHSPYRLALHGYAGMGFMGYKTHLEDNNVAKKYPIEVEQDLGIASFYMQTGLGLRYNVSKHIDVEARVMYVRSGDDEFDGGGWTPDEAPGYNLIKKSNTDNMLTGTLGLAFKLGKHDTQLHWWDPLNDINNRISIIENQTTALEVCAKGDLDNDGVCDDWDRQLDTPAGARVDGAGVALDMDLDGVIDLYDKCVTVPGPASNNGCPTVTAPVAPVATVTTTAISEINRELEGIEFELNSDKIRPVSYGKLNAASDIIKTLDSSQKFLVVGATDARGSEIYNQKLSERRAAAVLKYLLGKGVSAGMLQSEGRGKKDLKYPECDPATKCDEAKNLANRRVFFEQK